MAQAITLPLLICQVATEAKQFGNHPPREHPPSPPTTTTEPEHGVAGTGSESSKLAQCGEVLERRLAQVPSKIKQGGEREAQQHPPPPPLPPPLQQTLSLKKERDPNEVEREKGNSAK